MSLIKRPMICVVGSYILGLLLTWYQMIWVPFLVILFITFYLVIYHLRFKTKEVRITRQDGFLWFLPFMVLLGVFAMRGQLLTPEIEGAFEEEADCKLTGTITMVVHNQWGTTLYVKNNKIYFENRNEPYLCENVLIRSSKDENQYLVGNEITVYGTIQKFSIPTNPGQFNEKLYYQIENIDYKVKARSITITNPEYSYFHFLLDVLKKKLIGTYDTILSKKESGAIIAMLLGEKYLLEEEIKELYQDNGISHVLAISGLHVSLIGICIFKLLKKLKLPLIPSTFLSILFIYSYGVLTNFSVSTNRAVMMMIIMLLSAIFGKSYDMLSATAFSALLILLQNPLQIFHAGFLLSFGAVLGIAIFLPTLNNLFPSKNFLVSGLFTSVSAQILTLPLVLTFYYQLPTYSLLVNLLILPCVSCLMISALLAGIAGCIYLPLGVFLIGGSNFILKLYEGICKFFQMLPISIITVGKPEMIRILIYLILLMIFVRLTKRTQCKSLLILLLFALGILIFPKPHSGLEIRMLDVGQGEAIFMKTESGTTYLIDGGSTDVSKVGKYRLQPFLLSQGIDQIDYAIITHGDADHVNGLKELIIDQKIKIKRLVLPKIKEKDENYKSIEDLASDKGICLLYIQRGDLIRDGDTYITCLHPSFDYIPSSSNAYSTVLSISYGSFDMLLTGDLEKDGEQIVTDMLRKNEGQIKTKQVKKDWQQNFTIKFSNDYDVLKVAHHGSRNSSSEEFLKLVRPEFAFISSGKKSRYGHPHVDLLERLQRIGAEVKITAESGAITIKTDGARMIVEEYIR